MDDATIHQELNRSIGETRLGHYHEAAQRLENLQKSVEGTGWPEVAVGMERAHLHIYQGLYKLAHSIAYEYAQKTRLPSFPPADDLHQHLLKRLVEVTCFVAAMFVDEMKFPALEAWDLCLSALQQVNREELGEVSYRPYVLLEQNLYTIAMVHSTFKCPESVGMRDILSDRSTEVISWMLEHRMIFPVISIYVMLCHMDTEHELKMNRWQSLLESVHGWASPTALGNIYMELAAISADSDTEHRVHNSRKYCALALAYFQGSSDTAYRLRCRTIAIELSFPREPEIQSLPNSLNYISLFWISQEYIWIGHFATAQGVMLKSSALAARASRHEYFWALNALLDEVDELIDGTRMRILGKLFQIVTILSQGGQVSKVLEALNGIFGYVVALKIPYISGMHAAACSFAYLELGRTNIAKFWARECWAWWRRCTEDETSNGAALYFPLLAQDPALDKQNASILQARILGCLMKDDEADRWKNIVDGWCLVAKIEANIHKNVPEAIQRLDTALDITSGQRDTSELPRLRAKLITTKSSYILSDQTRTRDDKIQAVNELKKLVKSNQNVMSLQTAFAYLSLGCKMLEHFQDISDTPGDLTPLHEAVHYLSIAQLMFENSKCTGPCLEASFRHAVGLFAIWKDSKTPVNAMNAFKSVKNAENWFDRRRRELSSMSGIFAVLAKQNLANDGRAALISSMAFELSVAIRDGIEPLEPWLSVANGKARSISDSLGLGYKIPETFLHALACVYPQTHTFLQTQLNLMQQITGEAKPEKRLLLRAVNEDYFVRQLEGKPELADIQQSITAKGIVYSDLRNIIRQLIHLGFEDRLKIRFIDWFIYLGRLTLCAIGGDKPTKFWTLEISEQQVKDWKAEYLVTKEGLERCLDADWQDSEAPFRQLDALVAPLGDYVEENDLLILSPCRVLYGIPLHALQIKPRESAWSTPLIEQCKITYAPSFSVFAQCLNRSLIGLPFSDHFDPDREYRKSKCTFIGVYKNDEDHESKEEHEIHQHIVELASSEKDATCLIGSEATVKTFEKQGIGGRLIHFHGHCNFDANNVLDQALIFHPEDEPSTNTNEGSKSPKISSLPAEWQQLAEQITERLEEATLETNQDEDQMSGANTNVIEESANVPSQDGVASESEDWTDSDEDEIDEDEMDSMLELAAQLDAADDPDPSRFYPFYQSEKLHELSLGSIAMKYSPSPSEAKAIESEIELGSSTLPNELPIRRAFDLKFTAQFGPIIMLIACQSASQRVGLGDEPLGLATGFLCAGANAVVGTLWKAESQYARTFSEVFYKHFREQRKDNHVDEVEGVSEIGGENINLVMSLIDLSDLHRAAVCQLMNDDETRNYRYWAPFALMGSPFAMWADEREDQA